MLVALKKSVMRRCLLLGTFPPFLQWMNEKSPGPAWEKAILPVHVIGMEFSVSWLLSNIHVTGFSGENFDGLEWDALLSRHDIKRVGLGLTPRKISNFFFGSLKYDGARIEASRCAQHSVWVWSSLNSGYQSVHWDQCGGGSRASTSLGQPGISGPCWKYRLEAVSEPRALFNCTWNTKEEAGIAARCFTVVASGYRMSKLYCWV